LKDIIKVLEKTQKSYFQDWPTPNSFYYNTIGEIYIELFDNIPDKLWTPFGYITLLGGIMFGSNKKLIAKNALQNLKYNFIITNVTKEYIAVHKPNVDDSE
jgi:hypothetical protein